MKNAKLLLAISILFSLALVACKTKKSKPDVVDKMVAKSKAKAVTNTTEQPLEPKELQLGDNKLIYLSKYLFVKNANRTEQLKSISTKIIDGGYYNLNISKNIGTIGLNYQKLSVKPSMDGAINGLINGYEKVDGVTLSDKILKDVSDTFGFPAKIGSGKMSINTTKDGLAKGEFIYLVLQKGNELLLFQGIFERVGTVDAKKFQETLESLKFIASK